MGIPRAFGRPGETLFQLGLQKKRSGADGLLGLFVTPDGFTLCHVVRGEQPQPRLEHMHSVSNLTHEERATALADYVESNDLTATACVVVLPNQDYILRLLDRPPVEDDEIADSLPWLIKDVIDFDPADARVAHFAFPEDANRGRDPRLFVAAARRSVIEEVTALVEAAELELAAIDIAELALRNIAEELPEQVAGTAMLDLGAKSGDLALCHEGQLYLARTLGTGTQQIDNAIGNEIALDDDDDDELSHQVRGQLDELLLEIQRSLDYYESELGKAPASRLVIGPSEAEISLYVPYLTEQLRPVRVEQLELNSVVDCDDVLNNELQTRMLLALGGGLRGELEQQIDLSAPAQKSPNVATLPLTAVLPAAACVLLGLGVVWGLGMQQNAALASQVEEAKQRRDALNSQITALENQLIQSAAEREGADPLAAIKAQRDRSARRMRELDALGGGRREGFSRYFAGFAKQTVDDLWLDRIEVHDGGESLSIRGHTYEAKRVPQLLRRLRTEPAFSGKSFALFELASGESEGVLDFTLDSASDDGASR